MYGQQLLKLLSTAASPAITEARSLAMHPPPDTVSQQALTSSEALGTLNMFGSDFFNLPPAAATLAGFGYGTTVEEDEFQYLNWLNATT